jgi:DNA polymerase (family 10)
VGKQTIALTSVSSLPVPGTLPRNDELAEQLELLADLSELEGEDSFRVLAYRRAATRIRETGGPVAQLALEGKAKSLSGIGKTIEEKIVEVVETGEMSALAKRKALVPEEVVKFMRLPGLGPKTARRIWKELGVTTLAELKAAAEQERLRSLAGLGAKSEEKILKALAEEPKDPRESRRLLGDGLPVLLALVEELRQHPAAVKVSEAGSARRRRETFRDLDVIATSSDPPALIEAFTTRESVADVVAKGDTKATVLTHEGFRLDLRVVPPESYGNLLQHFTGSKDHNVALREDAVRRGLSVSEYAVTNTETGETFEAADEEELYAHLGYAYIPPELRENGGELDAARRGELPKLVERTDLRGDLHSHSTWSDGKATLEAMARAAKELGHEYLALCDHSPRLRDGRLARQHEEIDALNEELAPFRILKGIEVNIRTNGALDVADEVLEPLDWVMASVHASFDNDPTGRVLAAMENPHVDCIGHPTSRRIGVRSPSGLEIEKVVEAALATGTFLEINSQPDRLDLRDAHARLAGEAGLRLVISSDGHSTKALRYVDLGVGQARRAWLTKDQIVNTRSWKAIEKLRK